MGSSEQLTLSERLGARDRRVTKSRVSGNPIRRSLDRFRAQVRRRAHEGVGGMFLSAVSAGAKLHPLADPARHNVEVIRDIPYLDDPSADHHLDIYRPTVHRGPHPIVFYVHGGGFSLLSKDTHWVMALIFARYGYLVFNISYRLAPKNPYPAAIADTCAAYEWVVRNAERYGGDLSRVIVAGESAGANLVTSLSIASCYPRTEPWARRVFDLDVVPLCTLPACGIFQVTDTARFWRRRKLPTIVRFVLEDVGGSYLRGHDVRPGELDLVDPVMLFERGEKPLRPLPAFFIPVGTRDPLLDDTRRLKRALDAVGATAEARYYSKEIHAFHAMVWRKKARQLWADQFAFLERHVPDAPTLSRDTESAA